MAHLQIVRSSDILYFKVSERVLCRPQKMRLSLHRHNFRIKLEEFRGEISPEIRLMISELLQPKYRRDPSVDTCRIEATLDDPAFPNRLRICFLASFLKSPQAEERIDNIKRYVCNTLNITGANVDDQSSIA